MPTTLLVLAHPGQTSLSHLFASDTHKALEARGIKVDVLDLYQDNFAPALTPQERQAYYTGAPNLSGIASHAERLTGADTLILVFPTWWFGMPAILKGWIDRVFAPSIAFDHANNFGPIKPLLTELKSVLVITTLGSPWLVDWLILRRPVRRILKTAIFGLCAPKAKFQMLSLYNAEKPEPTRILKFQTRLKKALARL